MPADAASPFENHISEVRFHRWKLTSEIRLRLLLEKHTSISFLARLPASEAGGFILRHYHLTRHFPYDLRPPTIGVGGDESSRSSWFDQARKEEVGVERDGQSKSRRLTFAAARIRSKFPATISSPTPGRPRDRRGRRGEWH